MRGLGARCLSQADPHSVPWELGHLVRIQCATLGCQLVPKVGQHVLGILEARWLCLCRDVAGRRVMCECWESSPSPWLEGLWKAGFSCSGSRAQSCS